MQAESLLRLHEYNTVIRAELLATGYIRWCSNKHFPSNIEQLFIDYFGYIFEEPTQDSSNFITQEDIETAIHIKQEGNKLFKHTQFERALAEYTRSLVYNINDGKTRCNRCICYLKLHQLDNAINDARFAVYNEPMWCKSWYRLAQCFEAMQQYPESVNMLQHAIAICEHNNDQRNKNIIHKYMTTVQTKSEKLLCGDIIDHTNDKDRVEWKDQSGELEETVMNDVMLLNAPPTYIHFYIESILPLRLRQDLVTKRTDDICDEFERWMDRKWITKLAIFKKLNHFKALLNYRESVGKAQVKRGDEWYLSWSAGHSLYLNKRWFDVRITSMSLDSEYALLFTDGTYCVPTAKFLIQCVIQAIMNPKDGMDHILEQKERGVDHVSGARKPEIIHVHYRVHHSFEEIKQEMETLGIDCKLISLETDMKSCKKYDVDPFGWNYIYTPPLYRYDKDNEF